MSKAIEKYIDLSGLPTYWKGIDWKNSIGHFVPFKYADIEDELEIFEYVNDDLIKIKYHDEIFVKNKDCIKRCAIGDVLGIKSRKHKYKIEEIIPVNTGAVVVLQQIRIKDKSSSSRGYIVRCSNDDHEYPVTEYNLAAGHGCPLCTNQVVVKGVNDMATTNPKTLEYVANKEDAFKYTYKSDKSILFKCPDCGYEKIMKISDFERDGFSCNKCGDGISYPNKFAFNLLEQLNIDFKPEYTPDWIKPMRYDFYFELGNKKYILEMDGGWHEKDNTLSGKSKEDAINDDLYKNNEAQKHNIEVIRVECSESTLVLIKDNILKSRFSEIIDLSIVNWLECEKFTCTSLVKTACDYWNSGIHSCLEISKIMKLNNNTICRYLKKGSKLGLCTYTVEKVKYKNIERFKEQNFQRNAKPILCIETSQVFSSITICSKLAAGLYGHKLTNVSLYRVLVGKQESTHHLHFQYITREEFNTIKQQSPELAFGDLFILNTDNNKPSTQQQAS